MQPEHDELERGQPPPAGKLPTQRLRHVFLGQVDDGLVDWWGEWEAVFGRQMALNATRESALVDSRARDTASDAATSESPDMHTRDPAAAALAFASAAGSSASVGEAAEGPSGAAALAMSLIDPASRLTVRSLRRRLEAREGMQAAANQATASSRGGGMGGGKASGSAAALSKPARARFGGSKAERARGCPRRPEWLPSRSMLPHPLDTPPSLPPSS